ncbi:unnamed protein product, partial [Rotaria sordida]
TEASLTTMAQMQQNQYGLIILGNSGVVVAAVAAASAAVAAASAAVAAASAAVAAASAAVAAASAAVVTNDDRFKPC